MNRADPFTGYSLVLRTILYGAVPAFTLWQFFRLRRALHVFQLEGYKRARFLEWCRINRDRRRFLRSAPAKKPLVMTGRARRILVTATAITVLLILAASATAHLAGGAPYDIAAWALVTVACFWFAPHILVGADVVLTPVQRAINAGFLNKARAKLARVAPIVVGVTGSFGKTSTKFAVERLVGPNGTALATPGSFNTPLGVCRTINENLDESHRFFVVEMGAYGEGEIAELAEFVRPKIGVLTAIGPAHLERFGSMEAIERGKYELIAALPPDGTAVMNADDPKVRELAEGTSHVPVVTYGLAPGAAVTARDVEVSPDGTRLTIEAGGASIRAQTALVGRHALGHVLAGVAVALAAGRSLADLVDPIAALEPVEHRLQIIKGAGGVTVIDDAYNSNPDGAAAALEVLDAMPGGKKVVVTPGIVELGPLQAEENERFGESAAKVADHLIVVAPINRDALTVGAARANSRAQVIAVDNLEQATQRLTGLIGPGDVVLFENDLPDQYER